MSVARFPKPTDAIPDPSSRSHWDRPTLVTPDGARFLLCSPPSTSSTRPRGPAKDRTQLTCRQPLWTPTVPRRARQTTDDRPSPRTRVGKKNLLRQHAVAHQQRLTSSPVSQPPPTNPPSPSTNRSRLVLLPLNTHADTQHTPVDPSAVEPDSHSSHIFHYLSSSPAEHPSQITTNPPNPPSRQSTHAAYTPTGQGENLFFASQQRFATAAPTNTQHTIAVLSNLQLFFLPTPLPSRPDRLK